MTTDTTTDPELLRLLDDWAKDALEVGSVFGVMGLRNHGDNALAACRETYSHTALMRHIAEHYIRRDSAALNPYRLEA